MSRIIRVMIGALFLWPSLAWSAAHSVTLVGISGPGGSRFADQLTDELFEIYDIVPGGRYREAAMRLDRRGASPEDVQAVAAAIHTDAVIGGAVVGTGHERRLLIAVRDGLTGRVVARGKYDLSGRTLPLVRERVLRDIVRALELCGPREGGAVAEEVPPPPPEANEPGLGEPNGLSAEPNGVDLAIEKSAAAQVAPQGVFAAVGGSLLNRSLHFDVGSAPSFSGGTVSGVRVEGAVFPLALSAELANAHPVLASFGLEGSYEHIFTFTSTGAGGSSRGAASHWLVLLVGRVPLGHHARGGTLSIESGYQRLEWHHESQQDARVPDVDYQSIDVGLGWDRPLGKPWLVGALRAAYLAVLDAGNITGQSQYGSASGWGLEAQASLTAWPLRWLWLRLDARYDVVGLSYALAGTRYAHSSKDNWIGGALEVGFAL